MRGKGVSEGKVLREEKERKEVRKERKRARGHVRITFLAVLSAFKKRGKEGKTKRKKQIRKRMVRKFGAIRAFEGDNNKRRLEKRGEKKAKCEGHIEGR